MPKKGKKAKGPPETAEEKALREETERIKAEEDRRKKEEAMKIKAEKQYDVATSSFADFVDVLKLCKTEYTKLSRAARDYLQQPGVIEYLAGAPQWGGGFTRARAIGQVWEPKDSILQGRYHHWHGRSSVPEGLENLKPYRLLSERKFDKLLEVHKYYHRSGSAYGVH